MANKDVIRHMVAINEFTKYFAASAIALLADYATYWLVAQSHFVELANAAVIGYITGLVIAYYLISGRVFEDGWLKERRISEAILFAVSGALGIALTYGSVVLYISMLGKSIHGAKIFAIVISFVCVYLFRKWIVFRSEKK